ncbi:MAG TPA: hypothetical protein PLC99_13435 [Verrucomicrobiota bacterium]|nr:hypothetical protein [Verrucomicrobiota bacterium]
MKEYFDDNSLLATLATDCAITPEHTSRSSLDISQLLHMFLEKLSEQNEDNTAVNSINIIERVKQLITFNATNTQVNITLPAHIDENNIILLANFIASQLHKLASRTLEAYSKSDSNSDSAPSCSGIPTSSKTVTSPSHTITSETESKDKTALRTHEKSSLHLNDVAPNAVEAPCDTNVLETSRLELTSYAEYLNERIEELRSYSGLEGVCDETIRNIASLDALANVLRDFGDYKAAKKTVK